MYGYTPFIVIATALGGPQPLYGGVYTVEEYGQ
jgi:hypothetical protein